MDQDINIESAKPHHIFRANPAAKEFSPAAVLSNGAAKLLDNLTSQYNGSNNGDLSVSPEIMRFYGWTSKGAICNSMEELIIRGFIEQTRQGGRNKPSLYAVTWLAIDYCDGKLDVAETNVPSNLWKPENHHKIVERNTKAAKKMREKIKNS